MALLRFLIEGYSLLVLAAVIISWIPSLRETAPGRFIERATEPVLARIRQVIPPIGGIDLSALVLLLALRLIGRLLLY